jgi:hypothetical protein
MYLEPLPDDFKSELVQTREPFRAPPHPFCGACRPHAQRHR